MKKKLEAELISIAHRILKLKNKSELHQLQQEAQNLYEKLTLLQFVETHFADAQPTIGRSETENKIQTIFDAPQAEAEPITETPEPVTETAPEVETAILPSTEIEEEKAVEEEHQPEVIEPAAEIEVEPETFEETEKEEEPEPELTEPESEAETAAEETTEEPIQEEAKEEEETPVAAEDNSFKPAFELAFDTKDEEIAEEIKKEIKNVSPQIAFDDLLGPDYKDPVFVKPEELEQEKAKENVIPIGRSYNDAAPVISLNKEQGTSLNDRMSKGIIIGLNDRIAFMTHLFANSSEDYNRVLSQLMTFGTFTEAKDFIDNMVKPDYNNWEGKDEYAERFMEIIEKRFS